MMPGSPEERFVNNHYVVGILQEPVADNVPGKFSLGDCDLFRGASRQ
jgi:hypothetical protein